MIKNNIDYTRYKTVVAVLVESLIKSRAFRIQHGINLSGLN